MSSSSYINDSDVEEYRKLYKARFGKDIDKTDTSIKDESESHVLRIEINSRCGSIPIYGLSSKDKCAILKSIKSKLSSNLDNTDTEIDNLTKDK